MKRERDTVSLAAGLAVLALAVLLILDQADALELTPGWFGAAMAAAVGSILIVSGLTE